MAKQKRPQPQTTKTADTPAVLLTVATAFMLGLDGAIVLWGWTFGTLMVALLLFLVRTEVRHWSGLVVIALAWAALVPAAASLAFDTGKWLHYGLGVTGIVLAVYFVQQAVKRKVHGPIHPSKA